MKSSQSVLVASTCFMAAASAHLFISSPIPIPETAVKAPLEPDGSNFPCHSAALPGSGGQHMAVGVQQKLAFDLGTPFVLTDDTKSYTHAAGANTAVHGGGSCQLSITYETDPQKIRQASAWKVIYSITEGCPTNSPANLDGNYTGPLGHYSGAASCDGDPNSNNLDCVNSFDFTIPEYMKSGQATLAWTWFNNIGNREMYMNCASVDITGGSGDSKEMDDLPDLFLANLGSVSGYMKTQEGFNAEFPNPGKYVTARKAVTTYNGSDGVMHTISTAKSFLQATATYGGPGPSPYVASPPAIVSASFSAALASNVIASPSNTAAPSVSDAVSASASAVVVLPSIVPVPSAGADSGPSKNSTTTSGECSGGKVSCPSPGNVMCVNETTFGICDIDNCAVPQAVSAGTTCVNNVIAKRKVVRRRSSRLRRHVTGSHGHKRSY
jgi:hypothetical protein